MTAPPLEATLRPATAEDDAFLLELYASTRQEEVSAFGWSEAQAAAFLRLQHEAQRRAYRAAYPHARHDVILCAGERAGRLLVARGDRELHLVDIALLPRYRGSGLGARLVRALLDEAAATGRAVRLQVAHGNRGARRLYERLGFVAVGEDAMYAELEWRAGPT